MALGFHVQSRAEVFLEQTHRGKRAFPLSDGRDGLSLGCGGAGWAAGAFVFHFDPALVTGVSNQAEHPGIVRVALVTVGVEVMRFGTDALGEGQHGGHSGVAVMKGTGLPVFVKVAKVGQGAATGVAHLIDDAGDPGAVALQALAVIFDEHVEIQRRAEFQQSRHAVSHEPGLLVGGEGGVADGIDPDAAAPQCGGGFEPGTELFHGLAACFLRRRPEGIIKVHEDQDVGHTGVGGAAVQFGERCRFGMVLAEQDAAVVHACKAQLTGHRGELQRFALRESRLAAEGSVKRPLAQGELVSWHLIGGESEGVRHGTGGKGGGSGGAEEVTAVHDEGVQAMAMGEGVAVSGVDGKVKRCRKRKVKSWLILSAFARTVATKPMPNAQPLQPSATRHPRKSSQLKALEKERAVWLTKLDPANHFHRIFDHIPGVNFFVKDSKGRTMFASSGILQRYQMHDESEMLGLTDFDINPHIMAENYVRDDERLLSGKVKHIERLELWFDRQGLPDWFVVTKLPLLDNCQRPIGIMGVLRRAAKHEMKLPLMQTVSRAVDAIRRDYAKNVSLKAVAESCGLTLRNLQRRFQTAFGISPQEFLIKTRVLAAMRLLNETSLTSAEIASKTGFVDASSFAEQFKRRTDATPTEYRAKQAR
jgi:AraC-like DNA-binding protein/PAS domain-containing protein